MGYLGNDLKVAYSTYKNIDDISGSFNGSTTSFSLLVGGVAPSPLPLNSQQCLISVGGVVQRPDDTGAEGFRLSGGNIVFSSAPGTGEDFFGVILAGADYVNVGANFPSGSAAVPSITFDSDLDTGIYNSAANQVSITTAGTERLRIDSAGQIESVSLGSASAPAFSFTTDPNTGIYSPGADQVAISTNGAGRLFVGSGGQIGVGTSTVGSSGNANITIAGANNSGIQFGRTNATTGGGLLTSASGPGIAFHYYTGAVGSETYTEAMRLDSSGRLLVGTSSSPSSGDSQYARLRVQGNTLNTEGFVAIARDEAASGITSGEVIGQIFYTDSAGNAFGVIKCEADANAGTNDYPGRLVLATTADGASSPTERARITQKGGFKATTDGTYVDANEGWHEFTQNANTHTLFLRSLNNSISQQIFDIRANRSATSAYAFIYCYSNLAGGADLEFNLRGDGTGLCDGSWTGGGADYAEYFEWSDSNPDEEDRRGISVVLDGNKIREAVAGEDPIGVISGNPSVVGDAAWNKWNGKYLRDEFGTYIQEDYEVEDEDGNTVVQQRRKLNPAYDPDVEYISREQRPEWDCVGLMGKLRIRKGQVTGSRWIKMRDISDSVEEWLVR